eukprot:6294277-Ditylum_brightwellii.AAC.1
MMEMGMHQQVAMYQAVATQQHSAQQHQQQINAAVPPPNTQNENNGMSSSFQEYIPGRSWWTNLDNKDGK